VTILSSAAEREVGIDGAAVYAMKICLDKQLCSEHSAEICRRHAGIAATGGR
jgi:hypothetical protein